MLLVDRNFNSFAISNKQACISGGNLPELRYGELGFSLTQVSRKPLLQFSSYTKELQIIWQTIGIFLFLIFFILMFITCLLQLQIKGP